MGESKNGFVISDHMDSSLPKKKRKIQKKDHLSWQRHVCVLLVGRKQHTDLCGEDKKKNKSNISYVWIYEMYIQQIQVERLMTSNIAFVITVDWLRCEANCQTLLGGDDIVLSEKRHRSVCHGDWNQDRIFLLFYKRITPVYIVEEELISLEYSTFVERIVNEVPHLRRGKFSKLSLMKRSAHLQYPQIDLEISLLVDHLFLQWFYRWWCLRSEDKRFSWDIRATVFLTVSMFNLHSV